jgi:hypothetical protein
MKHSQLPGIRMHNGSHPCQHCSNSTAVLAVTLYATLCPSVEPMMQPNTTCPATAAAPALLCSTHFLRSSPAWPVP